MFRWKPRLPGPAPRTPVRERGAEPLELVLKRDRDLADYRGRLPVKAPKDDLEAIYPPPED